MQNSLVASRYAKSLLSLAKEKKQLDEVKNDMAMLEGVSLENPQFVRVLNSPVISDDKKKAILDALIKGKSNKITSAFIELLAKKGRVGYLPQIASSFGFQYKEYKGIQSAKVVSATSLNSGQKTELEKMVNELSGRSSVELSEVIDESLIGGFILTVGDKQIDQSVKGKISELKNKFKENPYIAKY